MWADFSSYSPYQIGVNIDYHAFSGRDMFNISLKGKVAQQVICTTSIPKLYELCRERTMLRRFFKGRNLSGIDSQVFLPITIAFFLTESFVLVVVDAKYFISDLRRHGSSPLTPIPKDFPQAAAIKLNFIFVLNTLQ